MALVGLVLAVEDDVLEGLPAEQAGHGGEARVVRRPVAVLRLLVLLRGAVEHRVQASRELQLAQLALRRPRRLGGRCNAKCDWRGENESVSNAGAKPC